MVDRETVEALPPGMLESVQIALMTLASSGVLLTQIEANAKRLTEGFANSKPEELAVRILDAQQVNRVLLGIHQLGVDYGKETSNEQRP